MLSVYNMSIDVTNTTVYSKLSKYAVLAKSAITVAGTAILDVANGSYGADNSLSVTGPRTITSVQESGLQATIANTGQLNTLISNIAASVVGLPSESLGTVNTPITLYKNINYYGTGITFNGGPIILDASGDSTAKFFITSTSTIIFGTVTSIDLSGGALPCNIYWVASTEAINFTGTAPPSIPGIFVARTSITFDNTPTPAVVDISGRLFAQAAINFSGTGAYSVDGICPAAPGPGPDPEPVPCFLADAPVLTPSGYKPIASLKEGDLVTTPGGDIPITKVKVVRVNASPSVNPYRIEKGVYGATQLLLISPNHCVQTSAGMVEAHKLGLKQETMKGAFNYYNLELPHWSNMIVAGVIVESLSTTKLEVMTTREFKHFLVARYGKITTEQFRYMLTKVQRLSDGKVTFTSVYVRKNKGQL